LISRNLEMLGQTSTRLAPLISPERTLFVMQSAYEPFFRTSSPESDPGLILKQPVNKHRVQDVRSDKESSFSRSPSCSLPPIFVFTLVYFTIGQYLRASLSIR
jgi:hypothetical protein